MQSVLLRGRAGEINDHRIDALDLLGISGIGNLVTAIKFAKYYELGKHDIVMTVLTDSTIGFYVFSVNFYCFLF